MTAIRWLLAWLLYFLGDLISRPMMAFDWAWLYRPYNKLMSWSSDIQVGEYGPWKSSEPDASIARHEGGADLEG